MQQTTVTLPAAIVDTMRDLVEAKKQEREYGALAVEQRALRAEAETTQLRELHAVNELQAREQEIAAQRLAIRARAKLEDLVVQHGDAIVADARFAPLGDWGSTQQRREVAA